MNDLLWLLRWVKRRKASAEMRRLPTGWWQVLVVPDDAESLGIYGIRGAHLAVGATPVRALRELSRAIQQREASGYVPTTWEQLEAVGEGKDWY